jgi:hypothetical protein
MPVTYRIEPDERIVYLTTTGDSNFTEWEQSLRAALRDPSYAPGFDFLSDRRQETSVPDTEFARSTAKFFREHSGEMGRFRWAGVSSEEATYGMLRMFTIFAEMAGLKAHAFRDYDEARQWLRGGRE